MHNFGWIAANLGFPFLGPIVVVKSIRLMISTKHAELRKRLRITYLLREGQFALTSLAVSTAALYEVLEADRLTTDARIWLVCLAVMSFFSVMLLVIGLLHETDDPETAIPAGSGVLRWTTITKWVETYRVGAASLLLALPVSFVVYEVHATLHSPAQQGAPIADKPASATSSPKGS